MNLGILKKMAVQLIDEFSNNSNITDDEDISLKLNNLFNIAQLELSLLRKINKVIEFEINDNDAIGYISFDLPDNFIEVNNIKFFSENDKILNYYIQNKTLKVYYDCVGKIELEYYARPVAITDETPDDHELELDIEAQMLLPYYVASDILKSDVSANYTAFEAKYRDKLEVINSSSPKNGTFVQIHTLFGDL